MNTELMSNKDAGRISVQFAKMGNRKVALAAPDKNPAHKSNKRIELDLLCFLSISLLVILHIAVFLAKLFNVPVTKSVFIFWFPTEVKIVFIIPIEKVMIAIDWPTLMVW